MLFLYFSEELVLQAAENGDNEKLKDLHKVGTVFTITNKVSITVVHSRDDKEVGTAHKVKSPKNQPKFPRR